jgi:tetratricopeptide (TPR) repeat protein
MLRRRFLFLILFTFGCAAQNPTADGIRYYGQARYDAAMTSFQEALKANPNDPNTEYNIAAVYHQSAKISLQSGQAAAAQQQYEQANQYYRLCLSKNPNHSEAYRGLAALYMDCRDAETAFQILIGWYTTYPASAEPKIELARLYQEYAQICMIQGRTEVAGECRTAAEKLLQKVLETEPSHFRALRALGYLMEQKGDKAGAVAAYQRSLQANPQQKDIESRIAVLKQ